MHFAHRLNTGTSASLQNAYDNAFVIHQTQVWSHHSHRRDIAVKHSDASLGGANDAQDHDLL